MDEQNDYLALFLFFQTDRDLDKNQNNIGSEDVKNKQLVMREKELDPP